MGYFCFEEISRQVTIDAQKQGISQLFLEDPLLFSKLLLEGREQQFHKANDSDKDFVFYDRGLPDVTAYLNYIKQPYPSSFDTLCETNCYDLVFLLPPWETIYKQDNERYETFEQAKEIHQHLKRTYSKYYDIIEVASGTVEQRSSIILNTLKKIL